MARTGRPVSIEKKVRVHITLREKYVKVLDLITHDPFLDRREYGERNTHIERALDDYFKKYFPEHGQKED